MNALQARLARLESRLTPPTETILFFVRFVSPGRQDEPVRAEHGGESFFRLPDESLDQFKDRINAATKPEVPTANGRVVLLFND